MLERTTVDDLIARLQRGIEPPILAVDGLPCAGKSTMVGRLAEHIPLDCICIDDFGRPDAEWPDRPGFPFEFVRYAEFQEAVRTLAATGTCSYRPFDWNTLAVSPVPRTVTLDRLVVVEGVSVLEPSLCPLYGLRVFVESDRASILATAIARGDGMWEPAWRDLFMPSNDLYMATHPRDRADLVLAGRGSAGTS